MKLAVDDGQLVIVPDTAEQESRLIEVARTGGRIAVTTEVSLQASQSLPADQIPHTGGAG